MSSTRVAVLAVLAASVCFVVGVHAQEEPDAPGDAPNPVRVDPISLWVSRTHSDNILRATDLQRGTYDEFGTVFNLQRIRERVEMGLNGSLDYREYADDAAEPERRGNLAAFATTILVPERFTWSFREMYTQTRLDPFEADRPGNREGVKVFSTGPELSVPWGRNAFNLAATYDDREYDESVLLESTSTDYTAGLSRRIRSTTTVGVSAGTTSIEYDEAVAGFDIDSAQLTYARTLTAGTASLGVGRNRAKFDLFESTGPLFHLSWDRTLTSRSTLIVSANRGFTETGRLLTESLVRGETDFTDVISSADVTDRSEVGVAYVLALPRTTIRLDADLSEDNFEQDIVMSSDRQEYGIEVRYQLSMRMTLGGDFRRLQRDFDSTGRQLGETFSRIVFRAQVKRTLDLEAAVQSNEGSQDDAYSEGTYRIRLTYVPGRR